jgi:high affinity sulfate transporter 1
VSAGVLLSSLLIPAGLGYAVVAGLPPIAGLHATVVGLVVYAALGSSRIMILGPDSSLAPIIGAAIAPLALGEETRTVALAGLLAILVGVLLVAGGMLRLGAVTELLSKPIRIGYLNGVALVVLVGQLPTLLGFSGERGGVIDEARAVVRGIRDSEIDARAAAIGVASLATILGCRLLWRRAPGMLFAVAGGAVAVWLLDLDVPVVGRLPRGLPSPQLGGLEWDDVRSLLPAAVAIAIVALADTAALSRSLAARDGHDVDESQEMVALGAANVMCGALGGFSVSGSASRTPAAQAGGARTQGAGLAGAATVALLVLAAPGLTRFVPSAALAAVVIAAVIRLADVPAMAGLWRMSRAEFALCTAAFVGVAVAGVLEGIGIAVALSLTAFVLKAWRPHTAELVRVTGRKGYHDVERHPSGRRIPGLVLLRFDAPLFFANGAEFARFVRDAVDTSGDDVRWVAISSEPVTDIDTTAAEELVRLDDDLHERDVRLVFAEMKGPVKDRLERYGIGSRVAERHDPTVGTAVSAYLEETGTPYSDWTDKPQ